VLARARARHRRKKSSACAVGAKSAKFGPAPLRAAGGDEACVPSHATAADGIASAKLRRSSAAVRTASCLPETISAVAPSCGSVIRVAVRCSMARSDVASFASNRCTAAGGISTSSKASDWVNHMTEYSLDPSPSPAAATLAKGPAPAGAPVGAPKQRWSGARTKIASSAG
jgi:hypothetical protein